MLSNINLVPNVMEFRIISFRFRTIRIYPANVIFTNIFNKFVAFVVDLTYFKKNVRKIRSGTAPKVGIVLLKVNSRCEFHAQIFEHVKSTREATNLLKIWWKSRLHDVYELCEKIRIYTKSHDTSYESEVAHVCECVWIYTN